MAQQLLHGHLGPAFVPGFGQTEEGVHRRIGLEQAALDQAGHHQAGEWLGNAGHPEEVGGCEFLASGRVSHPGGHRMGQPAVAGHRQTQTGDFFVDHPGVEKVLEGLFRPGIFPGRVCPVGQAGDQGAQGGQGRATVDRVGHGGIFPISQHFLVVAQPTG